MNHRIARWCFPVTLGLASVFVGVLLAGCFLEAPRGTHFWSRLGRVLLADTGMRTALLMAALGLVLTASLFFRRIRPKLPLRFRATDL